jgi:fucose 4-O-acetylase-like acetyltransferase
VRDSILDNFKFILIALVIVGHAIEPLVDKFDWVKSTYIFIYIFHIPMFAYVSGVVSSRNIDHVMIKSIVSKLIIPYVFLEVVYSIFDFYVFSRSFFSITPLVPYWIMWYLFSLIFWRMMLPIFNQFKYPIILSLLTGLACGISTYGYNLSFSRTFVFFPFFLIGHYYHQKIMEEMQKYKASKFIGIGAIVVLFLTIFILLDVNDFSVAWLYGSMSYSSLGVGWGQGVIIRFSTYVLAILLGMALLSIVQKDRNVFSTYGENSLYIYVLHGFVMKGLVAAGVYTYFDSGWKVVILIVISLVLLPVLCSSGAKFIARVFMNPLGFNNLVLVNKHTT